MKELPILFNAEMVRALLAGRKSQTRRIIRHQPPSWANYAEMLFDGESVEFWNESKFDSNSMIFPLDFKGIKCRYGKPGDLLYVKETFIKGCEMEDGYFKLDEDGEYIPMISFKADNPDLKWYDGEKDWPLEHTPWTSPLFLKKDDARIWLRNTGVRVERLQDISDNDAIAEGIESFRPVPGDGPAETLYKSYMPTIWRWSADPGDSFRTLIQSIHGPEVWENNPWMWVINFEVLSTTGRPE